MLELACKEAVFHFNKKHLEDPTIPMWVIKAKGKSYYVNHVACNMPWSTKETPENSHTKGAIKFKDVHLKITDDNCAELCTITGPTAARLRAKEKGYTRILVTWKDKVVDFLQSHAIKFTPFKKVNGSCGSTFYLCDIMDPNDLVMMRIGLEPHTYRTLNENERYYMAYDDPEILRQLNEEDEDPYIEGEDEDE